jgi:hypothetical protein
MTDRLDLPAMFPDLFTDLTPGEQHMICQSWAIQWHEGWEPNREDVADSIQVHQGSMTREEFSRRAGERARNRS